MKYIEIWKASIALLESVDFESYLQRLPQNWHTDVVKYVQKVDQKRTLLARLMLFNLLEQKKCVTDFHFNQWGKPFIYDAPFFNWSHSGDYVIFAWSDTTEIGVDVEQMNDIKIEDFKGTFSDIQWKAILESEDRNDSFYQFWTINEAVIKAIGQGLSFDLKTLNLPDKNTLKANDQLYTLREIQVDRQYKAFLSFQANDSSFEIIEKTFDL